MNEVIFELFVSENVWCVYLPQTVWVVDINKTDFPASFKWYCVFVDCINL